MGMRQLGAIAMSTAANVTCLVIMGERRASSPTLACCKSASMSSRPNSMAVACFKPKGLFQAQKGLAYQLVQLKHSQYALAHPAQQRSG